MPPPGSTTSRSAEEHPFACFEGVETRAGDEVATVHRLLPGQYENWSELAGATPAGWLTDTLRDRGGRVVRRWANPAHPEEEQAIWHVFAIDDRTGRVTSVGEVFGGDPSDPLLPGAAQDPETQVCPFKP